MSMMKKIIIIVSLGIGLLLCVSCDRVVKQPSYKKVDCVGTIPPEFETIVKDNLFEGVTAFSDRLFKTEMIAGGNDQQTQEQRIIMMDLYGKELVEYMIKIDDDHHINSLTATDDGGFLFVLGFFDHYSHDKDLWASANGFASRVIKCDKNGKLQFDTALEGIEGSALSHCYEQNGSYYLFGTHDAAKEPEKRESDVYIVKLDYHGKQIKDRLIRGSDFDSLGYVKKNSDGFLLSIRSQSDDGDFSGSDSGGYGVDWIVNLDQDLEIKEKKKTEGSDYYKVRIGEKNGVSVYMDEIVPKNFDAGNPTAYIDYGEYYLIVSENKTGVYEHPPLYISCMLYYTETVYSAYDQNGNLIFRTAVDSTPDYSEIIEKFS